MIAKYFNYFKQSLDERMKTLSDKHNPKCHCYKPHVFTIKSKQILTYMKFISISNLSFEEKKIKINELNNILIDICKSIYIKYDPTLIYFYNNEINIVFFYKQNGNYLYDGNINTLLTTLVSDITLKTNNSKIKNINKLKDVIFSGKFIEFDEDYEILNYIIWRQINCKRNTLSLFYKCLYPNESIDNIKTKDMEIILNKNNINIDTFLTGNILKKILYYKNSESIVCIINKDENESEKDLIARKGVCVENIYFANNFTENLQKYIKNKIL
jgi:tRNA(His) 5'-end guanylyltransferase